MAIEDVKRVSVPLQTPSLQEWNIITLDSHVMCVCVYHVVLFAFSMGQAHKSASFFQLKISTKTKQKEKKRKENPHLRSSIGIIIHQKNYSNKWLIIMVGVRLTWLTTMGGGVRVWDLEKTAPGHSEPATSTPSTGCLLLLSCGWTSTELIFGFTLLTNSVINRSHI
jgi:hypothetical protein